MSTPTSIPVLPARFARVDVVGRGKSWEASLRAMASTVRVLLGPGSQDPDDSFGQVEDLFADIESECTRFDPASDLMRANAGGEQWCPVGRHCYAAIEEAAWAYARTAGVFDPRVLNDLRRLGYGSSRQFTGAELDLDGDPTVAERTPIPPWLPGFDAAGQRVKVGPTPIDLGGIGKGLAVRWAAELLDVVSPSFLVDAGGDCYARGPSPEGAAWQLGVESPFGGDRPIAVLAITDASCVTSSIRLRHWRTGGRLVHHLIDPRTGAPGGHGLRAVTVVGSDPASAEVWSKVFFLHGRAGIAAAVADRDDLAVLWVHDDGSTGMNEAMRPLVIWQEAA